MVSFKCQQKVALITEQTLRDIFEERFDHPLTSVSIRKHQYTNTVCFFVYLYFLIEVLLFNFDTLYVL